MRELDELALPALEIQGRVHPAADTVSRVDVDAASTELHVTLDVGVAEDHDVVAPAQETAGSLQVSGSAILHVDLVVLPVAVAVEPGKPHTLEAIAEPHVELHEADEERALVGRLVLVSMGEQDPEALASALRPGRNAPRPPHDHVVVPREHRVLGRAEPAGDLVILPVESLVFGERLPRQRREVALEDVPEQDDLVVLALEMVEELPEPVGGEIFGADVEVRDDRDPHGLPYSGFAREGSGLPSHRVSDAGGPGSRCVAGP